MDFVSVPLYTAAKRMIRPHLWSIIAPAFPFPARRGAQFARTRLFKCASVAARPLARSNAGVNSSRSRA